MASLTAPTAMRRLAGRVGHGRARRAVTMLEFIMILPAMMFVALFTVDMGSLVLTQGAMQDAAYSAARAGAQVGGGALVTSTGTYPCGTQSSGPSCQTGVSWDSFRWSLQQVPGYTSSLVKNTSMQIVSGGKCVATGTSARPDNHVTIKVAYDQKLMTPGLALLMSYTGSNIDNGAWHITVSATSRCEVVR